MEKIKRYILLTLLFVNSISILAQEEQNSIEADSSYVLSGIFNYLDIERAKWITIGTLYDFESNVVGLELSNGYDERPLIHFEDFFEDFVFKVKGKTNLEKDYSYGFNFGWKYPRYLSLIAIEYVEDNYYKRDFQHRDVNINAETWIKSSDLVASLKVGFKNLNNNTNFGADIGLNSILIPYKLYFGISGGYYFDYFTYGAFVRGFIYKKIVSVNFDYDRIEKYNFINVGLGLTFKR